jgi:hypothetical protein
MTALPLGNHETYAGEALRLEKRRHDEQGATTRRLTKCEFAQNPPSIYNQNHWTQGLRLLWAGQHLRRGDGQPATA